MCGSMVDIQSATAENRRGKKKKEEGRRNHSGEIECTRLLLRAATNIHHITSACRYRAARRKTFTHSLLFLQVLYHIFSLFTSFTAVHSILLIYLWGSRLFPQSLFMFSLVCLYTQVLYLPLRNPCAVFTKCCFSLHNMTGGFQATWI